MKMQFKYIVALGVITVGFNACKKGEGEGGGAIIKGVLTASNVHSVSSGSEPEANTTIFISYGADRMIADKSVKTGTDGSFEIPYLRKGTYKIFAYSLDPALANPSTNVANNPILTPVEKTIEVTDKTGSYDVTDFVINKDADDGGSASIKGRVFAHYHDSKFQVVTGSDYHADEDVYINFGENVNYGTKVETSPDGSFIFNYMRKGKYSVYVYSRDTLPNPDHKTAVKMTFEITDKAQVKDLGTFIIRK